MINRGRPSQVRSGLAAKALKSATKYPKPMPQKKPVVHYATKTVTKTPIHPLALKNAAQHKVASTVSKPATALAPAPAQATPPVPVVKINENGQLDLPYGSAFGNSMLDYQTQMNSQLQDLQQSQQAQASDYAQKKRDLGQQYTEQQRGTLNQNASRGTAFSSAYGTQVADNATQYNNANNDLNTADAQAQAGYSSARTGIETAFNNYLRQAVLDRGVELAGQAGKLGYGQATAKAVYAQPKSPAKNIITKKPTPKAAAHAVKHTVKKHPVKKKGK